MIPILYNSNEYDFISLGIGGLNEATSCLVTEVRNGQYELEMVYPAEGRFYKELQYGRKIAAIPSDGASIQPFEIYRISRPINGLSTINAQHVSYQLNMIPTAPFTASNCADALAGLKTNAMESCPFTFWTDKTTEATYNQTEPSPIRTQLGGVRGSILDVYGGEYEWDKYTIKLHASRGQDNLVEIRYGKNITDINQEENIATTYTGAVGMWKGQDSEQREIITYTSTPVQSEYIDNYPYHRTNVVDFSSDFQNAPDATTLREHTAAYVRNNYGIPKVSLKVSFIPLWQTEEYRGLAALERVKLCDTVTVVFEKLGISTKAKITKTVYDVLLDRYKSIEIGDARGSITDRIS